MKAILLLLIAFALFIALTPFAFLFGTISAIGKNELKSYWFRCAISIDKLGGSVGSYFFNVLLIKPNSYLFGNDKETISSVLGKNEKTNNLTLVGKILNLLLNALEKEHSKKSIDFIV